MGRPSTYTPEIAAHILKELAKGRTLRAICKEDEGMPADSTVRQWALDNAGGEFAAQYAQARDLGLDAMADELMEVADTPKEGEKRRESLTDIEVTKGDMLEHRRLQVDTRKWYLSKLAPKRYGDRVQHEHSGSVEIATTITDARKRAAGQ